MITFSGQVLPTWSYQKWSISAGSSGWYAPRRRVPMWHAASLPRSRRSRSTKSFRGSWWPTSAKTRLNGCDFNLKVDQGLKEAQSNRCMACNIELLWTCQPKDTQRRESIAEGVSSFTVVWQKEQVGLMDLVWYRHVKFRPWYEPRSRQIDLSHGLLLEPILCLLPGHLGCGREISDGHQSLPVSSGDVINARKASR